MSDAREIRYHLIYVPAPTFSAMSLPGLDGLEVARRMQDWLQPPKIIFLSMNDSEFYRTQAQELGVFGFVDKAELVANLPPLIARLITMGSAHRTGEGA